MTLHPLVVASALALLFMGAEALVAAVLGRRVYRLDGAVGDLSNSLGNIIGQGLFGLTTFTAYDALQQALGIHPFDGRSPLHWVGVFLLVDLCFYLRHRACHRVAILWAIHEVHHQSEEYNFGTAQRAPWLQSLPNLPFAMGLAVLGVPLEMVVVCFTFKAVYGFFTHTRLVGRLGPLEWLLVTPSGHRVHHARNPQYIDKNYGNVLIVWDRLFGTYEDEVEAPSFGTAHPRDTDDVWSSNVDPFVALFARARTAPTLWTALQTLVRPPAWDPRTGREAPLAQRADTVPTPRRHPWRAAAGFGLCLAATLVALCIPTIPVWASLVVGGLLLAALVAVTRTGGSVSMPIVPVLVVAGGCHVVDAPVELEDLVVFGFTTLGDEAHRQATVSGLSPLVDELEASLIEGYRVTDLEVDDLLAAGVALEDDEVAIMGVSALVDLGVSLQEVADTWTHRRMQDVFSSTVAFDIEREDGDRACFLAHDPDCRTWGYTAHRSNDIGFFGTSEQDFERAFAWVEVDGEDSALVMRDLAPTRADMSIDIVVVDQQYAYTVFLGRAGTVVQVGTFWVDARAVGLDVPDTFALDWAVDGLNNDAEEIVAFIDSGR